MSTEHRKLTNLIITLLNKVFKKTKCREVEDLAYSVRLVVNNGTGDDVKAIANGVVKFASANLEKIKKRQLTEINSEHFNTITYVQKYKDLFSESEIDELWQLVDRIISQSAQVVLL